MKHDLDRAQFNRWNQLLGETAEQYIMSLYALVTNCNYGALEQGMIHNHLVMGIKNTAFCKQLQLHAELIFEEVKKAIHQREAV